MDPIHVVMKIIKSFMSNKIEDHSLPILSRSKVFISFSSCLCKDQTNSRFKGVNRLNARWKWWLEWLNRLNEDQSDDQKSQFNSISYQDKGC